MSKRLLLVGGGHAHMMTLAAIKDIVDKGIEITVLGPSEYHYYSGMGPGMLGGFYTPEDIRFATRHVVEKQGGTFVLDKAVSVDPLKKIVYTGSGMELPYDAVSFNAGSHIPLPDMKGGTENIYPAKPIERLLEARDRIKAFPPEKTLRIGILGGGPSSVEIAGNIWRLCKDSGKNEAMITILAGSTIMARFSAGIQKRVRKSLRKEVSVFLKGNGSKRLRITVCTLLPGKATSLI